MKKIVVLAIILVLSVSMVAFAVDSPTLSPTLLRPPTVSDVSVSGISIVLTYNEHTDYQAQALADAVKKGKTEIEFFELSKDDMAEIQKAGFSPEKVSVDDFLHTTISGYKEKPKSITFKTTFPTPYPKEQKVLLLMGVGKMPGPFDWSVQEAVVNNDGSLTITLNDFPAEPFMLSLLS